MKFVCRKCKRSKKPYEILICLKAKIIEKRYMKPKGITNIIVENANKISTVKDVNR